MSTGTLYLVEIRLGRTRWMVKQTISSLVRMFGIDDFMERHPHVTLFGPFVLKEGISPHQMLDHIRKIVATYDPVLFMIGSWEHREGLHGGVIAFSINPSPALKEMSRTIGEALSPITDSYNQWDGQPDKKWFHVTIANRLDKQKAAAIHTGIDAVLKDNRSGFRVRSHIFRRLILRVRCQLHGIAGTALRPLLVDEVGLRITIMCGQDIMAEYDLVYKRWVSGNELRDVHSWQRTLKAYRRQAGFELVPGSRCEIAPDIIFLIADVHFGHANIIRYCSRPFLVSNVQEMDDVLINNWNCTIAPENRVYFLGDLRYGRSAPPASEYLRRLNGMMTGITGNHDPELLGWKKQVTLQFEGVEFLLVHDPADAPEDFTGWVIHGHHHNNSLRNYPFINFTGRRVNVSAEVIGYVPVSLQEICRVIREHETDGDYEPMLLRYPYVPEQSSPRDC